MVADLAGAGTIGSLAGWPWVNEVEEEVVGIAVRSPGTVNTGAGVLPAVFCLSKSAMDGRLSDMIICGQSDGEYDDEIGSRMARVQDNQPDSSRRRR